MVEDTKWVGSECLGFRARLLSRVITAVYDDALAEVGLKVSQFGVLNAVASRAHTRPAELANVVAVHVLPWLFSFTVSLLPCG
jgi:hypothetical protein